MERIALVARLKADAEPRAAELIAAGPPFELEESGLASHTVYLSAGEVVFVFEGPEVEWIVDDLVDNPFRWRVAEALKAWSPLIEGEPRIARAAYGWAAKAASTAR
jgi:hypothetical protein